MIMIFSAARQLQKEAPHSRNMLQEAPTFFGKHLNYFKDKYPDYFCEMTV
jgi:hypothetical protein